MLIPIILLYPYDHMACFSIINSCVWLKRTPVFSTFISVLFLLIHRDIVSKWPSKPFHLVQLQMRNGIYVDLFVLRGVYLTFILRYLRCNLHCARMFPRASMQLLSNYAILVHSSRLAGLPSSYVTRNLHVRDSSKFWQ